ncbi:MAG: glycine oxidase ThiO [Gammaproteobacteria bacterium]|nr:glycine oxidase ThiO [Gammaproteobacteria bacterium]
MQQHIIIGGGLIGLLTAHYLRQAGQKISVLERGIVGRESSWAGGGILSPLYPWRYTDAITQLASLSQNIYPGLIQQLFDETKIDAQWNRCGLLILDSNEINTAVQWAEQYECALEIIPPARLKKITPNINPSIIPEKTLWLPDIAQIRNPRLIKALTKSLIQKGVTILENTPVSKILVRDGQLNGIIADGQKMHANSVTIACGAWSSQLLKDHPLPKTIKPVRGQMIVFKTVPQLLNTILLLDSHYLIPRLDGRILVGSTLEYVGFDKNKTPEAKTQLYQFATRIFPKLAKYPVEHHWAGLRPGSEAQTPFISQHPNVNGLYINTGHFRNGVVTAPASAQLLAAQILGKIPPVNRKPYTT